MNPNKPYDAIAPFVLAGVGMIVPPASAVLACGPIASGALRLVQNESTDCDAVLKENAAALERFTRRLREQLGVPVICASALRIEGWRGRDYQRLMEAIIEQYVCEAWFLDGWSLSNGATRELLKCLKMGTTCRTANGGTISAASAIVELEQAVATLAQAGVDDSTAKNAIAVLRSLGH